MKKIIFVVLFICSSLLINAQTSQKLERANTYFKRAYYNEAISIYENIYKSKRSFETTKNLADCHYYVNNMERASQVYKYLLKNFNNKIDDEYYFKYVTTLKASGKYNSAYEVMKNFFIKNKNEGGLKKLETDSKYLENIKAIGDRFKIENLQLNTKHSEFGAIKQGNKLIFTASKKESNFLDKLYKWDGQHYLDLYQININKIHLGDSVAYNFSKEINTKLHEANIIFTKDGKTAYFTRNNFVKGKRKKDSKKITHLQIYKAELVDGKWKNITSLPFNSNEYSTEHPALSSDEKTLYFASDMPGTLGSFDIFSVSINSDGSYSDPTNLGKTINTVKKEQFPFISKKNELYFSSNGHPGFGSLDVFVSSITSNGFSKPDNVGLPVNSGHDDFSFNIDTDTKEGYFASNRPGGKGNDDIYKIVEQKPLVIENCKQFISGVITDVDTQKPLSNTLVTLNNDKEEELKKINTDTLGKFHFNAECETTYVIKASKEGYTKNHKVVILQKERNKKNDASLALKSLEQLKKEEAIALELQKAKEQEQKVKDAEKLELNKKKDIENIIAKEKDIIKDKDRIIVKTEQINFDYKLWYLRRDTKKAIDRVITLMKKYPSMIIEVGTHSDIRGNDRYNLELSQKRATSVRMYFMENGTEPDRISAIGYGETKPLIKCKTEDSCTEEQHESNRRCEFIVKGF
ncbi:WD40 repeat protein [Tenacibaculum adriaticum]|uniref:WD40 repeat protein n=1 Tax=Tenacibaculum adriaticum TaxID=413713 RepID=A0A5S5DSK7_9FLAO|nr:OmpA family protein [Tenacibaculum adriaticum]TYP97996.1 WD40 repeat protein [Tenacibaculum adriaticum]